jgi:hypothetical protein
LLGVGYYLYRLPLQTSVRPIANAENPSTAAERDVGGAPPSSQNVSGGPIDASPADAAVSVPAASATEQSSNNTERTVTAPVAPVPAAAVTPPSVTRQETVRPASVPRPPRETRAYVPQPNIGKCTEEIAALGLCSPGARREGS